MPRFYVWLAVVTIVVIGCSGDPGGDVDQGDSAALDGSRIGDANASDGVAVRDGDATIIDVTADTGDAISTDNGGDRRADAEPDARDAGAIDARADSVDVGADSALDASADGPAGIGDGKLDEIDVSIDAPSTGDANDATYEPPVADGSDDALSDPDAWDGCTAVTCNLVSLSVTPQSPTISPHSTQWMHAVGVYTDASTRDLTEDVFWSRSGAAVHVSNAAGTKGLVTARVTGTSTITAELGGITGSATMSVLTADPAALRLTPWVDTIPAGVALPLKATVIFSDMSSWADWSSMMQWSSSNPSVATVVDGVVTGAAPGIATITATFSWLTASVQVTVAAPMLTSLSVEPAALALPLGPIGPLRAMGHFTDGSTHDLTEQAVWGSSNPARATVGDAFGSKGKVSGVSVGSATISASFGGVGATAAIDVSNATLQSIGVLSPPDSRLMMFMDLPMAAIGNYSDGTSFYLTDQTTWTSSDSSIIEVSGRTITGVGEGSAYVDAQAGGRSQRLFLEVRAGALESIAIQPSPGSVVRGASIAFYATGTYTGGSTYDLTWFLPWNTVDPSVAWIGDPGGGSPPRLTGVSLGTTNVTASWAGISASSVVDVTAMIAAPAH